MQIGELSPKPRNMVKGWPTAFSPLLSSHIACRFAAGRAVDGAELSRNEASPEDLTHQPCGLMAYAIHVRLCSCPARCSSLLARTLDMPAFH